MMWSPIGFAAWYQTWAITAAKTTNGSSSMDNILSRTLSRLLPSTLVNIILLSFPVVPSIAALIPGVIGNCSDERARHGWYDWHRKYDGEPEMTRDMLLDAQKIFHANLGGVFYLSVTLTIWMIVCVTFGSVYAISACRLIVDLYQHIASKANGTLSPSPNMTTQRLLVPFRQLRKIRAPLKSLQRKGGIVQQESSEEKCEIITDRSWTVGEYEDPIRTRALIEQKHNRATSFVPSLPLATRQPTTSSKTPGAYRILFTFAIQTADSTPMLSTAALNTPLKPPEWHLQ
ncbi:hypothetical protein A4X03_0g6331 [Tilletia caries]|uniref:Uncharacterized protein n=3 Tax=Tilletia TaxID=13289 RepID=A0A177TYZ1_9BASI|nr:hypothetical protein A4X03_0g6331 [Tilletia caries]